MLSRAYPLEPDLWNDLAGRGSRAKATVGVGLVATRLRALSV